ARPVGGAVADGVGADPVHHDRPGVRLPGAVADRVLDGVDAGTGVRGGHRHGRHVDIGAVVVAFAVHGRGRLGRRGVVRRRGDDREADTLDLGDVARLVQGPVAQGVV